MATYLSVRTTSAAAIAALLTGCAGSTIHTISPLGSVQTLSIDAKQRLVIQGRRYDGTYVTCAEPSPDALVAQAAVFSARGSGPVPSGTVSGNAAVGFQESAASLSHRTQTIQILRDGYYRLCEAYLNGAVDRPQYVKVVSQVDLAIAVIAAVDGLGNASAAPAVAIGTGNVTVSGGEAGSAGIGAAPAGTFGAASGGAAGSPENAAAIRAIIDHYIDYVGHRSKGF
jgi:hypothetical protein